MQGCLWGVSERLEKKEWPPGFSCLRNKAFFLYFLCSLQSLRFKQPNSSNSLVGSVSACRLNLDLTGLFLSHRIQKKGCCQESWSGSPAILTWHTGDRPIQTGHNQASTGETLHPTITLLWVLLSFFVHLSSTHELSAPCSLFTASSVVSSLPPSALHSFLSLVDCAKLPPVQGAAILCTSSATNRTLAAKHSGECHALRAQPFASGAGSLLPPNRAEVCCLTLSCK